MTSRFRPSSNRRKDSPCRLQLAWDCRKAFRPTRTTSSRASAWHGIRRETARPSFALPMECSTIIRCSASISSAMPPTDLPADSWPLRGTGTCSGAGNPGNLNAIPIFQGLPINVQPAHPCADLTRGQRAALGYLPNQQQFQSSELPPVRLSEPELSEPSPTFLPLGFQPFGYPQAKNFVYAYSQQANLSHRTRSRPRVSPSAWPTTSTADAT